MPSETSYATGRCYCGHSRLAAKKPPQTVSYCHCTDCRRISGAPVSALAAFAHDDLQWTPPLGDGVSHAEGVRRWFCPHCGSPLAAWYAYLPDQVYVPIGLFEGATKFAPSSHSHSAGQLEWLHLSDDLPRASGSNRDALAGSAKSP